MNELIVVIMVAITVALATWLTGLYLYMSGLKEHVDELRLELSEQKEKIIVMQTIILRKRKGNNDGKVF